MGIYLYAPQKPPENFSALSLLCSFWSGISTPPNCGLTLNF